MRLAHTDPQGKVGAGYGNRTRLAGLGSQSITTMLTPRYEIVIVPGHVS